MVTQPPYAWRILINGAVRASFAGTKRHARDLINRDMVTQDLVDEMVSSAPRGSVTQSAIEEKTPPDPQKPAR
jgi:hypothetical protein